MMHAPRAADAAGPREPLVTAIMQGLATLRSVILEEVMASRVPAAINFDPAIPDPAIDRGAHRR
jgi:hypothetical protein